MYLKKFYASLWGFSLSVGRIFEVITVSRISELNIVLNKWSQRAFALWLLFKFDSAPFHAEAIPKGLKTMRVVLLNEILIKNQSIIKEKDAKIYPIQVWLSSFKVSANPLPKNPKCVRKISSKHFPVTQV